MLRILLFISIFLLASCGLGPLLSSDVIDYFNVHDLAANRIILLNILRARDGAPLHFSELSLVRGQISASASASASFPFGPLMHATSPRRGASIGGNVSVSPSFDVGSLDTRDFTMGVMAPIAPATLKFFLDEGIDYRMVLLLLVSGLRTKDSSEILLNAPGSARKVCYFQDISKLRPGANAGRYSVLAEYEPCTTGSEESEFVGFLRVLDQLHRVYATNYPSPPQAVGAPFTLDMAREMRSLAVMDPAKYRLRKLPSGQYQMFLAQRSETVVLCEASPTGGPPSVLAALRSEAAEIAIPPDACFAGKPASPEVLTPQTASTGGHTSNIEVLSLRSTLEVIGYIGRVLAFQQAETARLGRERCVTLGFEGQDPGCSGRILFRLQNTSAALINLDYGGQSWGIPAAVPCQAAPACDHTLETLAMVALLLNQNKSARDIPSTPAFEAVP